MLFDNLYLDMVKQAHILIAGETGSGKSTALSGLLRTITAGRHDRYQLILIDPKKVELQLWREMPHTVEYASEREDMVRALRYAVDLCDNRYREMQRKRIRKYDGGHVWVIIDELADLMTTNQKEVAPLIQRICQIGRAANVHMIACTQCPLRKVIPTEIKCNFTSILGLRTRCAQDSRNILNEAGLETLPEVGYGIYRTPKGQWTVDIPYYSDADIEEYCRWRWENRRLGWDVLSA